MHSQLRRQLEESQYLRIPMKENEEDGGTARWRKKKATLSRKLPLAQDLDALHHSGIGTMSVSHEVCRTDEGSIMLETPMSLAKRIVPGNRAYTQCEMTRPLCDEDLTEYNRFSLWVYLDAPSTQNVFLRISLINAGEHIMPLPGRFEGIHRENVLPGAWHHIVWEIPDMYRDHSMGFAVSIPIIGSQPEGDERIRLYLDDMRIERVEAENARGFNLRKDAIAYCHSGYLPGARKQALVQHASATSFSLRDEAGDIRHTGPVQPMDNGFGLMDFSSFEEEGYYTLEVGNLSSKLFAIGRDAYLGAAWKTLNFFYAERCGCDVPGVHGICHQDLMCEHSDGRSITVCGGWHDAGDLSQILDCTCDSIIAMLELAASVKDTQPDLYARTLEEARWGLNWVMRTRFGDGYRHTRYIFGIWTKNMRGDADDMTAQSNNLPHDNMIAASACAQAAPFFSQDRVFANWCMRCAREDYRFAMDALDVSNPGADPFCEAEQYAQAAITATHLYALTKEDAYLADAARLARRVRACQQLTVPEGFALPLRGFFYQNTRRETPVAYFHKSFEHVLTECFARLMDVAPGHADAALWRECMQASGDYLREAAKAMPPYGLLPAGIYEVDHFVGRHPHDGAQVGMPTLEEYNAQVKNGIRLTDTHYLRRFPVAFQFRGFHATLMGKAKAAFLAARALQDKELFDIGVRQMEYILGFNPFAMSTVYGEGYDYPPLFTECAPQIVGTVPVGIETFENDDEPYMPMQNACTYKEIWVHSTARLMWLMAEAFKATPS